MGCALSGDVSRGRGALSGGGGSVRGVLVGGALSGGC